MDVRLCRKLQVFSQELRSAISDIKNPGKDVKKTKGHCKPPGCKGKIVSSLRTSTEHTSKDKDKGVEEEEIEEIDHVEKQMIQRISCENRMACEGMKLLLKEVEEEERNNAVLEEHEQMLKWCNKELQRVDRDKVELERKSNREG